MKEIPLTQGKTTLIDDEDYDELTHYKWFAQNIRNTTYVCRHEGKNYIYMHRTIMKNPVGKMVDHTDGDGLNNQKLNLRIVTNRENLQNRHHEKQSKYPGVHNSRRKKNPWVANIQIRGKIRSLGIFKEELDAATAYRVACVVLVGVGVIE